MPSIFDSFLPGVVADVVKAIGTAALLYRDNTSYQPADGTKTGAVPNYPINVLPASHFNRFYINGTTVLEGDVLMGAEAKQFITLGLTEPLATRDKVSLGGRIYQVVAVEKVMGGDLPVLFIMQLRT